MPVIRDYEEQVYAGVLGKIIGVYMGRPFEGWIKARLEERFGRVNRYVHEDLGKPLVVPDDDISGTLTFVRALEDSDLLADTPAPFFGQTWLNYLVEGKTVLWWGGMGVSTEHTAYLRLKHGLQAPDSGAMATNGRLVAEQIGAQIFIDAFGLVAPGDPQLAARLAERSARVSHDGEAVHAALVVAAMVSAAFVEKDMGRLLDTGVSVIPAKCLIARLHRDVRAWAKKDRDWRKTYDRIDKKYGYHKYGGGCHVIPNHAIMVMAWCYAPDDFYESQVIINTAGWDTDCNAANVGAVMGVKQGLKGIHARYDFQRPTADRILLPTAEGRACTDALEQALHIARLGRRIMGWSPVKAPKKGANHHFSMPGAQHGYASEDDLFFTRGAAVVENVKGHSTEGSRSLRIAFSDLAPGRVARVSTPILPRTSGEGSYGIMAVPTLVHGQRVTLKAVVGQTLAGTAEARLFVRHLQPETQAATGMAYGAPVALRPDKAFSLSLDVPDTQGWPVQDLGLEVNGEGRAGGEIFVDSVRFAGGPKVRYPMPLPTTADGRVLGWVMSADKLGWGNQELVKNEGRGVLATGTRDWIDYAFEAEISIHMADQAGLMVRYQGLERYIALTQTRDRLQLVLRYYGDTVLDEMQSQWKADAPHRLRLVCKGKRITAYCDGKKVLSGTDEQLGCGGAGFLVETGRMRMLRAEVR